MQFWYITLTLRNIWTVTVCSVLWWTFRIRCLRKNSIHLAKFLQKHNTIHRRSNAYDSRSEIGRQFTVQGGVYNCFMARQGLFSDNSQNRKSANHPWATINSSLHCLRSVILLVFKQERARQFNNKVDSLNACYHSVQNLLSSSLLSQNLKIKIYRNYNFSRCFVWMWKLIPDIEGET